MPPYMPRGSGQEAGQLPQFECTYNDCHKRFNKEKEMKRHKKDSHTYCKKCDLDCPDFESLVNHKIAAMTPWLMDKVGALLRTDQPKHIVCEFCGKDFKTFGGRKLHRQRDHEAEQNIVCPGCKLIFIRAADLIAHLEFGKCSSITPLDFEQAIQMKHVFYQYMEDLGAVNSIAWQSAPETESTWSDKFTEPSGEGDLDDWGSVSLSDHDDSRRDKCLSWLSSDAPEPSAKSKDIEVWPDLQGDTSSHAVPAVRQTPQTTKASCVANNNKSIRLVVEKDVGSVSKDKAVTKPGTNTAIPARIPPQSSWSSGNASKLLFPDAKPTPLSLEDSIALLKFSESIDKRNHLFIKRFWDPASADYDANFFRNPITKKYCCNFPKCSYQSNESRDFGRHLYSTHIRFSHCCISCSKEFDTSTGLIAHTEMSMKCRIKEWSIFERYIDQISGGFLNVVSIAEPLVYQNMAAGPTKLEFTGKWPNER